MKDKMFVDCSSALKFNVFINLDMIFFLNRTYAEKKNLTIGKICIETIFIYH